MTSPAHDDMERDAWLREALRHAPDADIAPPPALSDAILKQARAAAPMARAPATAPRATGVWAAAWSWLARPPVAAGFASVMAATLAGLMWWDRPMDGAMPRPPEPEPRRSASADPPPSAVAGIGMAPAPAVTARAAADANPVAVAPAAPRPQPEATRRAAAPAAPAVASKQAQAPGHPEPEPLQSERERQAVPVAPPTPAPEPVQAPPAAADAQAPTARGESSVKPAAPSGNLTAGAFAKSAAPPAAMAAPLRQDEASERFAPLAGLPASVAEPAPRWSWQRGAGAQAMTPALQRWLAQLDAATASRWRAAAGNAPDTGGTIVRLYRDGALRATLRLDDEGVWFTSADPAARTGRAALAPAAIAALKQALDEAAP